MATENTSTQLKRFQEDTVNSVLTKISLLQESGELRLPENYHAGNNLKLAWLELQELKDKNEKSVLEVCSHASICNALLEMVIKGLSIAKKQAYFIAYGRTLELQESYGGSLMIAKRDAGVVDVNAQIVYDGDAYITQVLPNGSKQLIKHDHKIEDALPEKIKGAYAIVEFSNGKLKLTEMTMPQIRKSWDQGSMKGNSPAHKNFPDQMCLKTVINRALKIENRSSDDSELDYENPAAKARNVEVKESANKTEIRTEDVHFEEVKNETNTTELNQEVTIPEQQF